MGREKIEQGEGKKAVGGFGIGSFGMGIKELSLEGNQKHRKTKNEDSQKRRRVTAMGERKNIPLGKFDWLAHRAPDSRDCSRSKRGHRQESVTTAG